MAGSMSDFSEFVIRESADAIPRAAKMDAAELESLGYVQMLFVYRR